MSDNKEVSSDYGSEDEANFVRNMQLLREQKGWSQGEFARRMQEVGWSSFHQTTVSRIEKGERPVRLGEARGIASILDTSTSQMILREETFVGLRKLEESATKLSKLQRKLLELGQQIEDQRTVLRHFIAEVLKDDLPEDTPGPIIERRDTAILRAKELLARTKQATDGDHGLDSETTER